MNVEPGDSFLPIYDREFAPRLALRAQGFRTMFAEVESRLEQAGRAEDLLVVETGSSWRDDRWAELGLSTRLFDRFVLFHGGRFVTIDINAETIDRVRANCSSSTEAFCMDSVECLQRLQSELGSKTIDLLYLDSWDLDLRDPEPSANHHIKELQAVWNALGQGSVVGVDDNPQLPDGTRIGKGMHIRRFLNATGRQPVFDGYQTVWRI